MGRGPAFERCPIFEIARVEIQDPRRVLDVTLDGGRRFTEKDDRGFVLDSIREGGGAAAVLACVVGVVQRRECRDLQTQHHDEKDAGEHSESRMDRHGRHQEHEGKGCERVTRSVSDEDGGGEPGGEWWTEGEGDDHPRRPSTHARQRHEPEATEGDDGRDGLDQVGRDRAERAFERLASREDLSIALHEKTPTGAPSEKPPTNVKAV